MCERHLNTYAPSKTDLFMPNRTFTVALPIIVSMVCSVSSTRTAQLLEHFTREKLKWQTRGIVTSRNLDQLEGAYYKSVYSITLSGVNPAQEARHLVFFFRCSILHTSHIPGFHGFPTASCLQRFRFNVSSWRDQGDHVYFLVFHGYFFHRVRFARTFVLNLDLHH